MSSLYLRPVQFVDSPVGHDEGTLARLAGGMLWFAAYEVIEDGTRQTLALPILGERLRNDRRAAELHARITAPRTAMTLGSRTVRFDQPHVVGIINATPDSFGGDETRHDDAAVAAEAALAMIEAGATLIDIGGESTRPGARLVWEGEEAQRVIPVIERLHASGIALSIDTRKASVMEAALAAGAHLVNDVSALLWDDRALDTVLRAACPVVLVHSPDPARGPHGEGNYDNVLTAVFDWLEARIDVVVARGVPREQIIVDPGIGFGKSLHDNLALINGLALFHALGCPVMLGASRKRMIGALSNAAAADRRLGGSIALAVKGAALGAQLIRVHDVAETVQALAVWRGLQDQALIAC